MKARQTGVSFCLIDGEHKRWYIDQILLKGAAIGGCAVPNTEFFAEIIGDELDYFILNFGYEELTYEEILLALRLNTKIKFKIPQGVEIEQIQFYGVCFNIDYFSKEFDRKLQNQIDGYSK